jgi:hypothetical protein
MKLSTCLLIFLIFIAGGIAAPKMENETARNAKVNVVDTVLKPSESDTLASNLPGVIVYLDSGSAEITTGKGIPEPVAVHKGETLFYRNEPKSIRNTGQADLHYVRVDLLSSGSQETWGTTGLSPNYKLLFENQYTRTYDIRIPARTNEPQHTHHDRVVVCLSGATLKHKMPDGREEPSTLKTGESGWRRGGTHIGQNLGNTDLWVIAIEPK